MGSPAPVAASNAAAWDFACPDWWARLKAGRLPIADLPIDQARGARSVAIYNNLRLPDVVGQPFLGEAGADWFREIVRVIGGSLGPDGARRVPEILIEVPKKNSKTTNAAGLTLTLALENKRPQADIMLLGPTQEIALTGFEQVTGMIRADVEGVLLKRFQIREHRKEIIDRTNGAKVSVKTFDPDIVTGKKPIVAVIDELHLLGAKHYADRVIRQLRGGMLPFAESLLVFITTQSDLPPAGVFKAELQHARAIRDGKKKGRMLPVLYEFPEAMQTDKKRPWLDTANWPLVQPNLNRSITLQALIDDFETERDKGEEAVRLWASQHLNVEIGLALHSNRWRGADYWEGAGDASLTLEALLDRSEVAVLAADAGGLDDLFGLAIAGRCRETRDWLFWAHAWADRSVLELRKDIAPALLDFEAAGDLTFTDTTDEAIGGVVEKARMLRDRRLLPAEGGIGLDPAGIGALLDALDEAGFEEPQVIGIAPQGYKLSSAIWSMERKLKDGTARHGAQPLMSFCVGNAAAEQRGNSVHITKQVAGKAKIDPLIACFLCAKLLEANPAAARKPVPKLYFV